MTGGDENKNISYILYKMPKKYPIYICPIFPEPNIFNESTCNDKYIFDNKEWSTNGTNTIKLSEDAATLQSALDLIKPYIVLTKDEKAYWAKSVKNPSTDSTSKTILQKSSFNSTAILINLEKHNFNKLKDTVTCMETTDGKFKCELDVKNLPPAAPPAAPGTDFGFGDIYRTEQDDYTSTNVNRDSLLTPSQLGLPSNMGGKRHQRKTKRRKHNKRKSHFKRK